MHPKPSLRAGIIRCRTTSVPVQTASMRGIRVVMGWEAMWVRVWVNQADPPPGPMSYNEAVSAQMALSAKVRMKIDWMLVGCMMK